MPQEIVEPRLKQSVDWSSALWAGLIAGTVFLLLNVFLTPLVFGGNPWVMVRLFASILLGESILAPPATFDSGALGAALLSHYGLSLVFASLIAFCLHRWGLWVGIFGGAAFGLALYAINFYTLTLPSLYPWFYGWRSWILVLTHVLFGAMAGGIYEALEVEEVVEVGEVGEVGESLEDA